jgi:MFS transporter, DHA1 family, tetracycline resistance protein
MDELDKVPQDGDGIGPAETGEMRQASNRALSFVLITILLDAIGLGIIIPGLPTLLEGLGNFGLADAARYGGILAAVYAIIQFFFAPILGGLSDAYGRRPVLLLSLVGMGFDYCILALAPNLWWLFIGRILTGITGASFTTAQAYIADVTPAERRSQAFGMVGAAFGVGFILGPLIGAYATTFSVRTPFWVAASLSLANFIYGYFVLPESLKIENRRAFTLKRSNPIGSIKALRSYPGVLALLLCMAFFYIAGHANQSASSYIGMERYKWGPKEIGYFLTYVGVLVALCQGVLIRPVVKRFGEKTTTIIGLLFYSAGSVLLSLAVEGWQFYAFFLVQALGFVAGASLQGMITHLVPANQQGELQGAMGSMESATAIVGPLLMLNLFSFFTSPDSFLYLPGSPYLAAGLLSLLGLGIFLSIRNVLVEVRG